MAWCRTGDKPLSKPTTNQFSDAYICSISRRWLNTITNTLTAIYEDLTFIMAHWYPRRFPVNRSMFNVGHNHRRFLRSVSDGNRHVFRSSQQGSDIWVRCSKLLLCARCSTVWHTINPCHTGFISRKYKRVFTFSIVSHHRCGAGDCWDLPTRKTGSGPFILHIQYLDRW